MLMDVHVTMKNEAREDKLPLSFLQYVIILQKNRQKKKYKIIIFLLQGLRSMPVVSQLLES